MAVTTAAGVLRSWAAVGGMGRVRVQVLAAGPADVRGDGVAGAGDGDVGEQQPGDALAFAGWGGRVVPDAGQVGDQLPDPGFLLFGELAGVLFAGFVVGGLGVVEARRAVFQSASRVWATSRLAGSTVR